MNRNRRALLGALSATGTAVLAGCGFLGDPESTNGPAKLTASDDAEHERFGETAAVSADGTVAVIGSPPAPSGDGTWTGAAYVFGNAGDGWSQQAKLAPEERFRERFANSLAVSDDGGTIVVGDADADSPNGTESGVAYVFERADGSWRQQVKLAASDGSQRDAFGSAVAVSADAGTVLVGATGTGEGDPSGSGGAYVFEESGRSWTEAAKLAVDDVSVLARVGSSVGLSADGSTAVVAGDAVVGENGYDAGEAYVFEGNDGAWELRTRLRPEPWDAGDRFGSSLDVSNDGKRAVVGARNADGGGAAYVLEDDGSEWTQVAELGREGDDSQGHFGSSVAMAGDSPVVVVGAPFVGVEGAESKGSGHVYETGTDGWQRRDQLTVSDDGPLALGSSVAVDDAGETVLAGTVSSENGGRGYVYD